MPTKLTKEPWLVAAENTPQKEQDFGLSNRSICIITAKFKKSLPYME